MVSLPSWGLFDSQSDEYKAKVLPPEVKARVAVEQAATFGWSQYVGPSGTIIGMRRFGASAPIKDLQKKFGFTTENVVAAARKAHWEIAVISLRSSARQSRTCELNTDN